MTRFLSDSWFKKIGKIKERYKDIPVANEMLGMVINVTVNCGDGQKVDLNLAEGFFEKGHNGEAKTTVVVTENVFKKVFIENDPEAGMVAFMNKEMEIDGDLDQLMQMQWVEMTPDQKEMQREIIGISSLE